MTKASGEPANTLAFAVIESDTDCNPGLLRLWREDVRCVFSRDPAARSWLEVVATYPGVHAILVHRVSHRLWLRGFRFAARLVAFFSRFWSGVDIHPGARIGRSFFIDHGSGVVIGETAVIGNDVTLYHGVTLGGTTWNTGKRHPTLGDGVLVGAGAAILGPVTLGDNVRVGANSVVIDDVPPNRTVVGIPARAVQPVEGVTMNPLGVHLDHHRIPDVVGQAIAALVERIEALEDARREPPMPGYYVNQGRREPGSAGSVIAETGNTAAPTARRTRQ